MTVTCETKLVAFVFPKRVWLVYPNNVALVCTLKEEEQTRYAIFFDYVCNVFLDGLDLL